MGVHREPGGDRLKSGKKLTIRCHSLGGFTLDETSQGALGLRLAIGTDGTRYCLSFGAPTLDVPGRFVAKASPAPTACP